MKVCSYCYRTDPNHIFYCPEYPKKARKDAEIMKQLLLDLYEYLDNVGSIFYDDKEAKAIVFQQRLTEAMNALEER